MTQLISDDPDVRAKYAITEVDLAESFPADAELAICLTFDTQGAIDALTGYQTTTWASGAPNWWDYSERSYGIRNGLPRILDLLDMYDITGTFPTCGKTAEWYPDAIRDIVDRGHELACHTYSHRLLFELDAEEERREVSKATRVLAEVTGERPVGWRSPVYSSSNRTIDLLTDYDYVWDSSFFNHDIPYILEGEESSIIEIPSHLDDWGLYLMNPGNDTGMHMGGVPRGTTHGVLSVLKAEIDWLHEEAIRKGEPRVFNYTMHPKISGRPHRTKGLAEFIEYAQEKDGVWFATCGELAELLM